MFSQKMAVWLITKDTASRKTVSISLRYFEIEIEAIRQKLIERGHLVGENEPMIVDDYSLETWIEQRCNLWNVTLLGKPQTIAHRLFLTELYQSNDILLRIRDKLLSLYGNDHIPWRIVASGSLSIDISPLGWDKRRCLSFLNAYSKVYFFGDRCEKDGNDYEIYMDPRTTSFKVKDADDTLNKVYHQIIAPAQAGNMTAPQSLSIASPPTANYLSSGLTIQSINTATHGAVERESTKATNKLSE